MIDRGKKALGAAIEHRTEDKEHTKAITAHFEAQADLYTQCQRCRAHLSGTREQILSHRCTFDDLIEGV